MKSLLSGLVTGILGGLASIVTTFFLLGGSVTINLPKFREESSATIQQRIERVERAEKVRREDCGIDGQPRPCGLSDPAVVP